MTPRRALIEGRSVGPLRVDPAGPGPRHGRLRRWLYAAAGDDRQAAGAAVVHLGVVAVVFVWALIDGRTHTWETRALRHAWVGHVPDRGAGWVTRSARVLIGGDGALDIDVPCSSGRLRVEVACQREVQPLVLVTRTPGGGWNVTQKAAGTSVTGSLQLGGAEPADLLDGGGWRDWTTGRQDRRTSWRWAAGVGSAADGRRVGLNVSTGMNGAGAGEDVVWWDGVPHPLAVDRLRPLTTAAPEGPWEVAGTGWHLGLEVRGIRAADERLPLVTSRYTQPIGRFVGTLPDPSGLAVPVTLTGVTEDHLAVW